MTRFQIRAEPFGLAIVEAESALEALAQFLADLEKPRLRELIRVEEDGTAEAEVDGQLYRAVS